MKVCHAQQKCVSSREIIYAKENPIQRNVRKQVKKKVRKSLEKCPNILKKITEKSLKKGLNETQKNILNSQPLKLVDR